MSYFTDRLVDLPVPSEETDRARAGFVAPCDRRFQIRLTQEERLFLEEWIPNGLHYQSTEGGLECVPIPGFVRLMEDPNDFAAGIARLGIHPDFVVRTLATPGADAAFLPDLAAVELAVLESLERNQWYRPEDHPRA